MVQRVGNHKRCWSVLDYENDDDLQEALECASLSNGCNTKGMDGFCSWEMRHLDPAISFDQSIENELARLRALRSYGVLEAPRDAKFERITALASRIFSVPIALVSFVDMGRQWFLSNRGLGDVRETPRDVAFCAHAILSKEELLIVNDTLEDERFCNNGLVTGGPHIRFYAGAPLVCPEGFNLGTLCIIDSTPRPEGLSLMEKQNLRELSAFVVDTLVQRREEIKQANEDKYKIIACTAHDLLTPLFGIQLNLSLVMDDAKLWDTMNSHQKDLIQSASSCTDIMNRICHQSIDSYRGSIKKTPNASTSVHKKSKSDETGMVKIKNLVTNLRTAIEPYPKNVPIHFEVADDVPPIIQSDDATLFRSALNYLTNACKVTRRGSIILRIFTQAKSKKSGNESEELLVVEVDDSGPGIYICKYQELFSAFRGNSLDDKHSIPNTPKSIGLGLSSVAANISALHGDYGFTTKNKNLMRRCHSSGSFLSISKRTKKGNESGSIFWFSIPIILPNGCNNKAPFETSKTIQKKQPQAQNLRDSLNELTKTITTEQPVASKVFSHYNCSGDFNVTPHRCNSKNDAIAGGRSTNSLFAIKEADNDHQNANFDSFAKTSMPVRTFHKSTPPMNYISSPCNINETSKTNKSRAKEALIIDDSLTIRKSIDRALKNLGFQVSQAENGMEGLVCMKKKTFDLVLCDFLMPIMDGLDCVKQYRTWEADHRPCFRQHIIGISAHASPDDAHCGMSIGMDTFLSKPLKLKTIKDLVVDEKVIAQSKILDAAFLKQKEQLSPYAISKDIIHQGIDDNITVSQIHESAAHHLTGPACLIAEDSKTIGKTLVRAIEKKGYRTSWVETGDDALRLLKMRNWDIVFLDEQMPLLSGSSCVTRFRTWEMRNRVVRQKNIFLLSGDVGSAANFKLSGFDGALEKPLKLQVLYDMLAKVRINLECNPQDILLRY